MAGEGFAKWLRGLPNQPPFSVDRSATPTRIKDHPCLMATPPVAWPKRSAAGICHDHPDCQADPVMAARCRGFSDACVRGVAPPVWEPDEATFFEAGPAWTVGLDLADPRGSTSFLTVTHVDHDTGTVRLSSQRVSEADAPEFVRTGFGEYRLTLPIT